MKTTRLIPSLALLAVLTACSKKDSAEHYLDAQNYIASHQYSAAIIELRSAIQQDPDNYRFRLALGQALLLSGDVASAERELERALRYGAPAEEVAFDLMHTHYLVGNYPAAIELLAENHELSARTRGLLDSFRALSEVELGDSPAGLLHFEQLSGSTYADIAAFANAHLKLAAEEAEQALTQLLAIDDSSELYAEALYLQGKIHLASNDILSAITHLKHYTERTPTAHLARLLLAQAYVRDGQFAEGEQHLKSILRIFPEQPMANYLQSIISFQREDFAAAKEQSEKAIRSPQISSRARIIAALSSVRLGLESQALNFLTPIRDQLHSVPDAQRLYAVLQLRVGETEEARRILASLPEEEQNLQLIANTAFELVRKGATDSAQDLISQYEQHSARDAASLTTLGTIKLGIDGQREAGIRDLEQALTLDPSVNQTRLVLAMTYLQQGDFDKASELAEQWLEDEEMQVAGYNLQAYALFLQQRFDESLARSGKALAVKPLNPFSSLLQAMVRVQEGNLEQAQQQLRTMLDEYPEYLAGLEQYYAISRARQDTTDATRRIERLFAQSENIYPVRLLRARVAHDQRNFQDVIRILEGASIQSQDIPALHHLILIESQQQQGNLSAAVRLAERWHRQQPGNAQAGYAYANALALNNERESALELLNRLLVDHPGHPSLVVAQITLLAQLDRLDQAIAVINNLPSATAQSPQLQFVKGRLLLMKGDRPASLQAFQNSYAATPTHETAVFIALNIVALQSEQQAVSFLQQHMDQHGSDQGLDTYYATLLLKTDAERSKAMYHQLLQTEPNNVVALNNYAWLLSENNQPAEAKPYAERAMELVPNHPDIIDTYGKILMKLNQPEKALAQFERSLDLRPAHAEVMLNYAEALGKTNQASKARDVLSQVQSEDPTIIERKSQLQQQLQ
ncbi:XrtA/PEP-CTERM system TPR-repeat protein PrsT [Alkalimonas mucilaginosa]|uniref:PEP-CTERM system TPR-repeat protein PrsT n=1 Tax=Alkalimonas mucilaginosa TaxID=3057676 RepID=A0ABU7JB20_9GAMM|nr:XrtA/PEP-CTERM system TPR-repeat protein PrsT [Alkalimonas sp. MEB004]MEE2022887.1 PEP-CTERM system TPR-repeat protein PrsT [Alkalimonas sp. MEB004]